MAGTVVEEGICWENNLDLVDNLVLVGGNHHIDLNLVMAWELLVMMLVEAAAN